MKTKKFLLAVSIATLSLVIAEIWVVHALSIYGSKAKKIENLHEKIKLENEILQNEILYHSSLNKIATTSSFYGLNEPKKVQYIR